MSLLASANVSLLQSIEKNLTSKCETQSTSLEQILGLGKANDQEVQISECEKALSIQGFLPTGESLNDAADSGQQSPSILCFSEESEVPCSIEEIESVEEPKHSMPQLNACSSQKPNRVGEVACYSPGLELGQTEIQDFNINRAQIDRALTSFEGLEPTSTPLQKPRRAKYLKQIPVLQIRSLNRNSWDDPQTIVSSPPCARVQSARKFLMQLALTPKSKDSQMFVNYVNSPNLEHILFQ